MEPRYGEFSRALGARLRRARTDRELTLRDVAARCGGRMRPSSVGSYERGERALSLGRFVLLTKALGTSPEAVLRDTLTAIDPDRGSVVIDLTALPDDPIGRRVASFAHEIRTERGDHLSTVITLRTGDLEVLADDVGLTSSSLSDLLGDAVLSSDAARPLRRAHP